MDDKGPRSDETPGIFYFLSDNFPYFNFLSDIFFPSSSGKIP